MNKNIVVIGLGNFGKWHIYSLKKLKKKYNIYGVEKNITQIKKVKKFISLNNCLSNITISKNFPRIKQIDLLILSTRSKDRHNLLKKILLNCKVKKIILEKVVSDNIRNLKKIKKLILKYKVQNSTFVNCPRREWQFYQGIKKKINNQKKLFIKITGYNWNISSNLIHVIDLCCYILNNNKLKIYKIDFDKRYKIKNKIISFGGKFLFKNSKAVIKIEDKIISNNKKKFIIEISYQGKKIIVNELKQELYSFEKNKISKKKISIINQSLLTAKIANKLLSKKKINLVKFIKSYYQHELVFEVLNNFHKKFRHIQKSNYIT